MRRLFTFLLFVCITNSIRAQDSLTNAGFFRFSYENDLFTAADIYYTQGVRLELALPGLKKNPVNFVLPKLPERNQETFLLSLQQQCFTATIISDGYIRYGDRPFSGTIVLGMQRLSANAEKQLRLNSSVEIGGLGPCSGCEQTQEGIHEALGNTYPHGWKFQVKNDFVFDYSVKLEKQISLASWFVLNGTIQAEAGTLYTNGGGGIGLKTGRLPPFTSIPHTNKTRFWLYANATETFIGYNATLQGGLFNQKSIYTIAPAAIERMLFRADAGLVLAWRKTQIEYGQTWLGPEFEGGLTHKWGRAVLSIWF